MLRRIPPRLDAIIQPTTLMNTGTFKPTTSEQHRAVKLGTWGGCHDSCDFTRCYGEKKTNLPALVLLDSERERCGAIVALNFNQYANNDKLTA